MNYFGTVSVSHAEYRAPLLSPPAGGEAGADPPKPARDSRRELKEAFVLAKYGRRRFAPLSGTLPGGSAPAALWEAAQHGDVRCALQYPSPEVIALYC